MTRKIVQTSFIAAPEIWLDFSVGTELVVQILRKFCVEMIQTDVFSEVLTSVRILWTCSSGLQLAVCLFRRTACIGDGGNEVAHGLDQEQQWAKPPSCVVFVRKI